ncbi:MAG TPA: alpha/beta hydrolase [Flexivirga sp.]|uniref:alpha/beta hydrolase n=1 Tax=Flexivirga sp. TaxID=1962927 RepID=UPI002B6BEB84|nr:alpha/beta hydrolase [Flexivirga sp.]HWC24803.1 alpha/beta hydrolase [Flexivirga sp.]
MTTSQTLHYRLHHVDEHTLLACDPPGGRRVVEAFGDVALADHIAVIVPGNGHHLGNYFTDRGPVSPRARGVQVLRAMSAAAPGERVAVVVWVGYRTPAGMASAFSNSYAREGADDLARLTHYLPRSAHLTLIGHSYGSAVCGLALPTARVDDCVALGSAGMGARRRDELGGSARLWAAQTESDWIRFFPHGRIGRLGLGRPPLHPAIRATRFGTGDITGHCGYYTEGSESLRNIARIATGRYDDVTPAGAAPVQRSCETDSTATTSMGVAA